MSKLWRRFYPKHLLIGDLPSGKNKQFAIEHGHRHIEFSHLKVIFQSYFNVYQRLFTVLLTMVDVTMAYGRCFFNDQWDIEWDSQKLLHGSL